MMFMNAQKPGLIKDAYIYGSDSIILDLEDAVAENQKDAARFSLYHALKSIDYGDTEVIVRINGLDTPHWREDVRVCVAGGADGIRIAKCENAEMVRQVEEAVLAAEREFGVEEGRTLLMAALESPMGIMNAYEIVTASDRMLGCAISGGDFRNVILVVINLLIAALIWYPFFRAWDKNEVKNEEARLAEKEAKKAARAAKRASRAQGSDTAQAEVATAQAVVADASGATVAVDPAGPDDGSVG